VLDSASYASTQVAGATDYVAIGPIPAQVLLLGVWLNLSPDAGGRINLTMGLSKTSGANAATMAEAERMIDRGDVLIDGQPAMEIGAANNSANNWFLPLYRWTPDGPSWLLVRQTSAAGIINWKALYVVVWDDEPNAVTTLLTALAPAMGRSVAGGAVTGSPAGI